MKIKPITLLFCLLAAASSALFGQVPKDQVVPITATLSTTSPLSVTLTWTSPGTSNYSLLRREKGAADWFLGWQATLSTATSITDPTVESGKSYEYALQRVFSGFNAFGYAAVSVNAPVVDDRGRILVVVEAALEAPLAAEIARLEDDLAADGWRPVRKSVDASATVSSVKAAIQAEYDQNPGTKAVFLLGAVPIPYSGNVAWDGHPEHAGAWPADAFYGDMAGTAWTDATVNNAGAARDLNDNVPGDGKFDQNLVPSPIELMVGRVDFRRLVPATFGVASVNDLYKRYLNKNHRWRQGLFRVDQKALVDDNFGYFGGESFASDGFRNAYPVVGAANVVETDFFVGTESASYLYGYGTGPGTYTSAGGVGTSAQFGADSINIVFSNLFGSYFGDWDYEVDPFMPSALASKGGILSCGWAGRPHWFGQTMAFGDPVGEAARETQNAQWNNGYFVSYAESGAHVALMGDPTSRAAIVRPPSNGLAQQNCETVELSWSASPEAGLEGYLVFRSTTKHGIYERLTANPTTQIAFLDENAPIGTSLFYQIRAVKKTSLAAGGSFFNASAGAFATVTTVQPTFPTVTATAENLNCDNPTSVPLTATSSDPQSIFFWQGPNAFVSLAPNATVSDTGTYELAVVASNGCLIEKTVHVGSDFAQPGAVATGAAINCTSSVVTLGASSPTAGVEWLWSGPNQFASLLQNPQAGQPGTYTLTVINPINGCLSTATADVTLDNTPPNIDLPAFSTEIVCCTGLLTLPSPTVLAGQTFGWGGPCVGSTTPNGTTIDCAGQYALYVTDPANGCSSTFLTTITKSCVAPTASATVSNGLDCSTSTATVSASSQNAGATFLWSGPGGFSSQNASETVSGIGFYTVVVTDPATCQTATATVELVGSSDLPNLSITGGGVLTCVTNSVELAGASTTGSASFLWSGPGGFASSLSTISVAAAGEYRLQVTAPNGCTATQLAVVTENKIAPNVFFGGNNLITCAAPTATITAGSTNPDVVFDWGVLGNSASITVSQSGSYNVVATDPANGCTTVQTAFVSENKVAPNVTFDLVNPLCAGDCAKVTVNSTTAGVVINSLNCPTLPCTVEICQGNVFAITATDPANGCTTTTPEIVITQPAPLSISVVVPQTCNGTATPEVAVSGGTPPYLAFQWTPTNLPIPANTTFSVTVTDSNGCKANGSGATGSGSTLEATTTTSPEIGAGTSSGSALAEATGGQTPYSFLWSNGQTGALATGLAGGNYGCTVTDAAGCTKEVSATVETTVATGEPTILAQIQLAPNPTEGLAQFVLELKKAADLRLEISTIDGKIISQRIENQWISGSLPINLSGEPSGTYLVRAWIDGLPVIRKLTVIR